MLYTYLNWLSSRKILLGVGKTGKNHSVALQEQQQRQDQESRKHHDTLLPSQKSPVPLNRCPEFFILKWSLLLLNYFAIFYICGLRYEDQDVNGNQAIFLNAGRKPEDCKMVARALFSFQVRAAGFLAPKFKNSKWRSDAARCRIYCTNLSWSIVHWGSYNLWLFFFSRHKIIGSSALKKETLFI